MAVVVDGQGCNTTLRCLLATVVAVVALVGMAGVASAAGEERTASASKTSGLDPSGETVTVTGSGFDPAKGIYVSFCVDQGSGQRATPCLGGVDTSGASGSSAWISSNPPAYGEGLARPYGPDGSFSASLTIKAADQFVDCRDPSAAPNGCVIFIGTDHTRFSDRSQDVRIPVRFAGDGGSGGGSTTDDDEDDGGGLPKTGATVLTVAGVGVGLLGAGSAALVANRRRTTQD